MHSTCDQHIYIWLEYVRFGSNLHAGAASPSAAAAVTTTPIYYLGSRYDTYPGTWKTHMKHAVEIEIEVETKSRNESLAPSMCLLLFLLLLLLLLLLLCCSVHQIAIKQAIPDQLGASQTPTRTSHNMNMAG